MIADRLNQNTGACYPSLDTLATDCGMARRSVINQIVKLETAGLLSVERSNEDHVKQNNHYHLPTTPSVGANNTPVVNVMHGGGESSSAKVVNEVHLKQNNITKNQPLQQSPSRHYLQVILQQNLVMKRSQIVVVVIFRDRTKQQQPSILITISEPILGPIVT